MAAEAQLCRSCRRVMVKMDKSSSSQPGGGIWGAIYGKDSTADVAFFS
jgi:hypothetical protein